jgi:hypothetical protein
VVQTDTRSAEQIRRDAERNRAELTDTVHQLRETVTGAASDIRQKLSPDAIKGDVSDYFRARGESLIEAARRNPMQAAAVGALAVWPLARIARSIPLPVMMIGAGLFLTGSQTGQRISKQAADRASDLADTARRMAHDVADQSAEAVAAVADKAASMTESVRSSVAATANDAADGAREMMEGAASGAHGIAQTATDVAHNVTDAARNAADTAATAARDGLDSVRRRTSTTGDMLFAWAQNNPALAAGIGLAIGGFIASALPRTDVEKRVAGAVADTAKSAASHGVATAVGAATGAVADMAARAVREGFGPHGVAEATQDLGDRALKVAEAAASAALGETQDPNHQQHPAGA